MARERDMEHAEWLLSTREYAGQPLMLRVRPRADSQEHQRAMPHLGVVSHQLADVRSSGLPEADYNESLAAFDADVLRCMQGTGEGLVVLIETFAGKRNYYAYVTDEGRFRSRIAELRTMHPEHTLTLRAGPDPEWRFYSEYRSLYGWDEKKGT